MSKAFFNFGKGNILKSPLCQPIGDRLRKNCTPDTPTLNQSTACEFGDALEHLLWRIADQAAQPEKFCIIVLRNIFPLKRINERQGCSRSHQRLALLMSLMKQTFKKFRIGNARNCFLTLNRSCEGNRNSCVSTGEFCNGSQINCGEMRKPALHQFFY